MFDGASAVSHVKPLKYNWKSYSGKPVHLIGDNIPWTNINNRSSICSSCNGRPKAIGEYCIECDTDSASLITKEKDFHLNYFNAKPCRLTVGVRRPAAVVYEDI